MIGLTVLALLAAWVWLATRVGKWIASKLKAGRWSPLVVIATVTAFLVLPVADEIVGGFQFRALCKENASEFRLGVKNPEGRTTKLTISPSNRYLAGTAIPIRHSHYEYHDVTTGELVMAHDYYVAKGGILITSIWASDRPITFHGSCSPERGEAAHTALKFNVLN